VATDSLVTYPSIEGAEDPYPAIAHMEQTARAYQVPGQPDLFVVSRYDDIRYVTNHRETFTSDLIFTRFNGGVEVMIGSANKVVTESDLDEHRRKRKICFPAVRPGRLKELEPEVRELADTLIDGFGDAGRVEFVEAFSGPFPAWVACRLGGLPDEDVAKVREWGALEVPGARWLPEEARQRQIDAGAHMFEYLTGRILERRDNPGNDAITHIIDAQLELDGAFNLDEVRAQFMVVLLGGVVTTSHFLSTAMRHLLRRPDLMARIRADHGLIPKMIEEALRLETPVTWHARRVLHDTELGGVPIPKDAFVLLMSAAANRDATRFPDPTHLDLDRPNLNEHVSFGYGPHFCLGAPLARMESRIAFERLLTRLADLRLAPGQDFRHIPSPQFRGLQELHLEFEWAENGRPA